VPVPQVYTRHQSPECRSASKSRFHVFGSLDPVSYVFLLCFFIGVLYVLATAAMGLGHDALHLPSVGGDHGHAHDFGGHESAHGPADATGHDPAGHLATVAHADGGSSDAAYTPSPISLFNVMAFLTCFGASGYILRTAIDLWWPLSVLLALVTGLLGAGAIWLFLARVLLPGAKATGAEQLVGKVATVAVELPAGGIGEIIYTLGGARHSDGARSVDGTVIPRGSEVVITRVQKGIAYVDTFDHYTATEGNKWMEENK
jgi:hypothetical protein